MSRLTGTRWRSERVTAFSKSSAPTGGRFGQRINPLGSWRRQIPGAARRTSTASTMGLARNYDMRRPDLAYDRTLLIGKLSATFTPPGPSRPMPKRLRLEVIQRCSLSRQADVYPDRQMPLGRLTRRAIPAGTLVKSWIVRRSRLGGLGGSTTRHPSEQISPVISAVRR